MNGTDSIENRKPKIENQIAVVSLAAVALFAVALGWRLIVIQQIASGMARTGPGVSQSLGRPAPIPSEEEKIETAFLAALNNDLHGLEKALDSGVNLNVR